MGPLPLPLEQRFWRHVDKSDGCWSWKAARNKDGYGLFSRGGARHAHRTAYFLAFGEFDRSLSVLHMCDNPSCVRPSHLFLGTQADNMRDMAQKGRSGAPVGEAHGNTKLTNEQVSQIRSCGESQELIAARFGIAQSTVSRIKAGLRRRAA